MDRKVEQVFANVFQLKIEDIQDEFTPNDIHGWDSLGHLSLISAIEQQFNTTLNMEDAIGIQSVKDVKRILNGKGLL